MTDNTTDMFRSSMRTVLDMAPASPDLPTASSPEPVRRPVAALVAGFAVVLIVVGLGTLVLGQGSNDAQDVGTDVLSPTVDAQFGDSGPALLSALPMIGTDLPGWEIAVAIEEESADGGGLRIALYYRLVDDDTVFANLWIRGITEGSAYEGDLLMLDQTGAEKLTVRGHDARMTVDGDDFNIAWRDSSTAIVRLAINTEALESGRTTALAFAASLIDLTPEVWAQYLATAGDVVSNPTTTTMAD